MVINGSTKIIFFSWENETEKWSELSHLTQLRFFETIVGDASHNFQGYNQCQESMTRSLLVSAIVFRENLHHNSIGVGKIQGNF